MHSALRFPFSTQLRLRKGAHAVTGTTYHAVVATRVARALAGRLLRETARHGSTGQATWKIHAARISLPALDDKVIPARGARLRAVIFQRLDPHSRSMHPRSRPIHDSRTSGCIPRRRQRLLPHTS